MPELSAREVSARLGVRLETVYAYVSRGVLNPRRDPATRRSVFDSDEVEAVARRGRPRRGTTPSALDLVVETGLTTIAGQRLLYRGRDACALAVSRTFEQVASWLWTGRDDGPDEPWSAYAVPVPPLARARDRIRSAVVLASAGAAETAAAGATRADERRVARSLIATMVEALPAGSERAVPDLVLGTESVGGSIAGRLWVRLTDAPATPARIGALNAALVLLADHELASSTMAVRIAASVRADPFSLVLAGLGPLAGPLHGSMSVSVHRMLGDALEVGPHRALTRAVEAYGRAPGCGHALYPDGDPRATLLLGLLATAFPRDRAVTAARAIARDAEARGLDKPNVDFALGVLSVAAGMPEDAGETVFTLARCAGWIAHAIEESGETPVRYRARAVPRPPGR